MAIVVASYSADWSQDSGDVQHSITVPTGSAEGDLWLLVSTSTMSGSERNPINPEGWAQKTFRNESLSFLVSTKVVKASDLGGPILVDFNGGFNAGHSVVFRITGAGPNPRIDLSKMVTGGSSSVAVGPVATARNDMLVLYIGGTGTSASCTSQGGNQLEYFDRPTVPQTNRSIGVFSEQAATPGSYNDTFTTSFTEWVSLALAISVADDLTGKQPSTPYHISSKPSARPAQFRLVPDHPLSNGLIYAWLGANIPMQNYPDGTNLAAIDSSPYGDRFALNNLEVIPSRFQDINRPTVYMNNTDFSHIDVTGLNSRLGGLTGLTSSFLGATGNPLLRQYSCSRIGVTNEGIYGRTNTSTGVWEWTLATDRTRTAIGGQAVITNEWTSMVGWWDGVNLRAYVNGSAGADVALPNAMPVASTEFHIGHDNRDQFGWRRDWCDPIFWNRALTDDELRIVHNAVEDHTYDGWIEPYPTRMYSFPVDAAAPPTGVFDIFESAIIGV